MVNSLNILPLFYAEVFHPGFLWIDIKNVVWDATKVHFKPSIRMRDQFILLQGYKNLSGRPDLCRGRCCQVQREHELLCSQQPMEGIFQLE